MCPYYLSVLAVSVAPAIVTAAIALLLTSLYRPVGSKDDTDPQRAIAFPAADYTSAP